MNENRTYQKLLDSAIALLRGKFIIVNAYIRIRKKVSNKNPNLHFKTLEKKSKLSPKQTKKGNNKNQGRN